MNTTISAAAGGLSAYLIVVLVDKVESVIYISNGLLAGLVGVTASCNAVTPFSSIVIGLIAGAIYVFSSKLMLKLGVDDPLDAFSIHGACGMWGVLSSGLFNMSGGLFTTGSTDIFLGSLLGILVIGLWSSFWAFIIF